MLKHNTKSKTLRAVLALTLIGLLVLPWADAQVLDPKKIRFSSYARGLMSAEGLREDSR